MTQAPLDEDVAPRRRGGRSALPLLNMGSRLGAMAWGLLGSLIVLGAAIVFALPRVPAVFSYRGFPSGMTSAADRGVVPEARLETQTYFPDPDDYTRAYRARKIADGALRRWDRMNEINAPEGVQLHWTAPMDYLAAGAGLLAAIWAASADGFEIGVALLPVALGVVYLCLLIWFVRRISGWPAAILCGAVAAVSPAFHRVFALGHADHHCLLEVLLIASIVLIAGRSRETSRRIAFFASGCLMGLAIWTASQAAIFWLGFFVVILIAAIRVDPQRKRSSLSRAHMWATGSFLVVGLGYLLDSFDDLKTATLDRISAVHFGLLFIAAILTRAIYSASGQPRERRERPIAARWAFIGIALVCLILFFKRATYFEHMQGEVLERWHTHIAELQPMIASVPQGAGLFDATAFSLQPLHDRLGYTMYLLPLALPYFLLSRRTPGVIRAILGILAPLIAGLSVEQLRWMDHYNTFVLPVIVVGLWEVLGRVSGRLVKPVEKQLEARSASEGDPRLERDGSPANVNHPLEKWRFAISFVILAAATVPFSTYERLALVRRANSLLEGRDAALGSGPRPSLLTEQWHTADVSLRALGPREDQLRTDFVARAISLREIESPSPESRRAVLCDEGEGPALLHETGLPVVAAPYHRAIDGIVEMMQFFAERDPVLARGRLDRLGARYVVVPYRINEQLMNYEQIAFGERRSFDPPREWLDENGRLRRELQYRPELTGTMAYRLSHRPHDHGIAGVEMLYSIRDDPARPDDVHGLLFVVNDITGTP